MGWDLGVIVRGDELRVMVRGDGLGVYDLVCGSLYVYQ